LDDGCFHYDSLTIKRFNIDGTGDTELAPGHYAGQDGQWIYYLRDETISRISRDGAEREELAPVQKVEYDNGVQDCYVAGGYFYYYYETLDTEDWSITTEFRRMKTDGSENVLIQAMPWARF
jgi:hypothetical protein